MTDYFIAIVMSVIQGLTEFLPISSSAHLLIPSLLFGITDLGLNFDIAVHFGTLTAVVFYFRDDIVKIFNSFYNIKDVNLASYRKLGLFVLIASIPAIIIGPFFSDALINRQVTIHSIAISNLIFANLLLAAYLLSKQKLSIQQLTYLSAFLIGCFQIFAFFPGASRSGVLITGALILGFNLKDGSKFAFLLAIPAISGALIFMVLGFNQNVNLNEILILTLGFLTSAFVAFFTIEFFLRFVNKIGMYPFIFYRFVLGLILIML